MSIDQTIAKDFSTSGPDDGWIYYGGCEPSQETINEETDAQEHGTKKSIPNWLGMAIVFIGLCIFAYLMILRELNFGPMDLP